MPRSLHVRLSHPIQAWLRLALGRGWRLAGLRARVRHGLCEVGLLLRLGLHAWVLLESGVLHLSRSRRLSWHRCNLTGSRSGRSSLRVRRGLTHLRWRRDGARWWGRLL
jgi:hypothetical protein